MACPGPPTLVLEWVFLVRTWWSRTGVRAFAASVQELRLEGGSAAQQLATKTEEQDLSILPDLPRQADLAEVLEGARLPGVLGAHLKDFRVVLAIT